MIKPTPHAVLLVHGIGDNPQGWDKPPTLRLQKRIQVACRRLAIRGVSVDELAVVEPATWSDILQKRQRVLSEILKNAPDLLDLRSAWPWDLWKRFVAWWRRSERAFVAEFVGDVIGYRESEAASGIRRVFVDALEKLANRASPPPQGRKIPLTIIAYSLGCVIASDFIWDQTRERAACGQSGFHPRFELRNLFTIGSPLTLFSLRYGGPNTFNKPIAVEHASGRWVNIYDRDDPIGMPLKPLNAAYDRAVFKDACVQAGLYLFSHQGYFSHNETLDIIARKIVLDWLADAQLKPLDQLQQWTQRYDRFLDIQ